MRRLRIVLGLAALVAIGSNQALVGTVGEIRSGRRWQTRLRLFSSQPNLVRDADRRGALRAQIPSFGLMGSEGGVYLPTRTVRIAIPEGEGSVRLQAVHSTPTRLRGLHLDSALPRGAPWGSPPPGRARPGGPGAGAGLSARAAGDRRFIPPGEPVRIGDVG
jgi:hypothetical protein